MRYTLGGAALHDVHHCAADDVPAVLSAMILCSQVWGREANQTIFFSIYFDVHGFFYYLHNRAINAIMRIICFLLNLHQDLRGKCTLTPG